MLKRNEHASHLVNGMAQRVEHALVGHLGHGRMSVNRMCNVFEDCAHFQGQRPFTDKFADVGAHALNAKDAMVVFSCDDTDKAPGFLGLLGE